MVQGCFTEGANMTFTKPPKRFLIDSFEYEEYIGEDDWGKALFKEPVLIKNTRFEMHTRFSNTINGKEILYNGLILCYNGITEPLLHFKEQSRVTYKNETHIINKVTELYEPYQKKIYSIEIEVI